MQLCYPRLQINNATCEHRKLNSCATLFWSGPHAFPGVIHHDADCRWLGARSNSECLQQTASSGPCISLPEATPPKLRVKPHVQERYQSNCYSNSHKQTARCADGCLCCMLQRHCQQHSKIARGAAQGPQTDLTICPLNSEPTCWLSCKCFHFEESVQVLQCPHYPTTTPWQPQEKHIQVLKAISKHPNSGLLGGAMG